MHGVVGLLLVQQAAAGRVAPAGDGLDRVDTLNGLHVGRDLGSAATSKFKGRSALCIACPACRIHARMTPSDCIESGGFVFGR